MDNNSVFELVDFSDEDVYFPIGIYKTLSDAIESITSTENIWEYGDGYSEDYVKLEVRERYFGISTNGKVVYTIEYESHYNDETDEHEWRVISE